MDLVDIGVAIDQERLLYYYYLLNWINFNNL